MSNDVKRRRTTSNDFKLQTAIIMNSSTAIINGETAIIKGETAIVNAEFENFYMFALFCNCLIAWALSHVAFQRRIVVFGMQLIST